ncbi:MAG: acyl-[Lachnospiraceae bacterium]|nr:acyl-[acyl-carrier-protein] thioesterase [Lachnospiraceae bacterium]
MYSFQTKVRYSETDEAGRMNLDAMINYFQDCSVFHSESLGLGVAYLKENHLAWVMSAWQIVIEEYPRFCEDITVATFPYAFKGFIGYRNFFMENIKGEKIVKANSIWTLIHTNTMHPVKPNAAMEEGYVLEEKLDMEYAPRKIALPSSNIRGEEILVKAHHIDSNNHVNNAQYISMAMDYLRSEQTIHQLRAEYKKQAVLGDVIVPFIGNTENGTVIQLCDTEERPYAVIEVQ